MPDNAIAISRIMKAPQKNPSLKVVQGDPCLSPKGGTLKTNWVFTIQGLPPGFDIMYLALADRNMQVKFGLKVIWEF